jgi:biotin operon repressor
LFVKITPDADPDLDGTNIASEPEDYRDSQFAGFQTRRGLLLDSVESSERSPLAIQVENGSGVVSTEDISNNDFKIISLLKQDTDAYYSFKGLMRKLDLHQESLSRALNRLQGYGLVQHSANGYKLNQNEPSNNLSKSPSRLVELATSTNLQYDRVLQIYLPVDIRSEEIVRALNGKWFRRLRWLGLVQSESGYLLQWINEGTSFQIKLRLALDHITVESNAASDSDKIEAMVGSCRILEQIMKVYQTRLDHRNKHLSSAGFVA